MLKNILHIVAISSLVYAVIFLGSLIPINLGSLNPFKKSMGDYEATDLVFSKFKDDVDFDDRIVIINVGKPNREEIAIALKKLDSLKVRAIGVDVVFEKYNSSAQDSFLQAVVHNSSSLVLADEYDINMSDALPHVCNKAFCDESNTGYTNFLAKPNQSIRYFLPTVVHSGKSIKSYAAAIVEKAELSSFDFLVSRKKEVEQINYRGNSNSYVQIEIDDFIKNEFSIEVYSDKIVLLGYLGYDQWTQSSRDKFFTPLNKKIAVKTAPDMFGVLIHANIISMILDKNYINESSVLTNWITCLILVLIFVAIFRSIFYKVNPGYWKIVRVIQLVIFFILFSFSTFLFYFFNLKLGIGIALIGVALSWDLVKIYENIIIRKQKFLKPKIYK